MAPQFATDKESGAEAYKGSEICRKLKDLLHFPDGLRLFDDIQKCRYENGRVLMKRDKKVEHEFNMQQRSGGGMLTLVVQYDTEIRGYVDRGKMKEVKGVKIKELLEGQKMEEVITISEISIDDPSPRATTVPSFAPQICFKSAGIEKSYPVGGFQIKKKTKYQIKNRF